MKNKSGLIVSILLVLAIVFGMAACGGTPAASVKEVQQAAGQKTRVQWLVADKIDVVGAGGLTVTGGASTLSGGVTLSGSHTLTTLIVTTLARLKSLEMEGNAALFDLGHTATIQGTAGNLDITVPATSTVDFLGGGVTVAGTYVNSLTNVAGSGATPYSWSPTLGIMNGTDTVTGISLAPTNADHTGAANYVYGLNIGPVVADAEALEAAIKIGPTWDYGLMLQGNNIAFDLGRTARIAGAAGNLDITVPATSTVDIVGGGLTVALRSVLTGGLRVSAASELEGNYLYADLGHTVSLHGTAGNLDVTVPATSTVDIVNGGLTVAGDTKLGAGSSVFPTGAITDTSAVFVCAGTLAYTNVTNKGICVVPANANVTDFVVVIATAFDDTGTDYMNCGFTWGTPNEFAANLVAGTPGVTRMGADGTVPYASIGDIGAAAKTLWCKYTGQNSNAANGAATITLYYLVD